MGDKYNLNAPYKEEYKLTITEFVNDIDFYQEGSEEGGLNDGNKLVYIKNSGGTGVIDRITNSLHFDIEEMAKVSREERFNMFKVVKLVYNLERIKYSDTSWKITNIDKERIPITKILQKPRLSNIKTINTENTVYGEYFDKLYNDIKSILSKEDVEYKEKTISKIVLTWENMCICLSNFLMLDSTIQHESDVLNRLKYMRDWFKTFYERLNLEAPYKVKNTEKIMPTFFNILLNHKMSCFFVDTNYKNTEIDLEYYLTNEWFQKEIHEFEWCTVKYEKIERFGKYFMGRLKKISQNNEEFFKYIFKLISCGVPFQINNEDINFAIKYLKTALTILFPNTNNNNFFDKDNIVFSLFLTIMQELVYLRHENVNYSNDYVGAKRNNKNNGINFTAVFKKFENSKEKIEAIALDNIKSRLKYRYLVNIGGKEFVNLRQEINSLIFNMVEYILRYQNFDDMVFVSDFLYNHVRRKLIKKIYKQVCTSKEFEEKIQKYCYNKKFECIFNHVSLNLLYEDINTINNMAIEIANIIKNLQNQDSKDEYIKICDTTVSVDRTFNAINSYTTRIFQRIIIDRLEYRIFFCEQFEVAANNYVEKAKSLGLGKFVR